MAGQRNLLVTLADSNYIDQAKQLFSSVYWNAGWEGEYMLLSHDIPEPELQWFSEKGILVKRCKPLHNASIGENYSPVVLDKFYLFTPEFKQWQNIIYLDSDIIVRSSLNKISKIKGFCAVTSTLKLSQFSDKANLFKDLKKNYNLNIKTCNTGILAFSSDIITEDALPELTNLFDKYKEIILYADEAVLNLFFNKKWRKLPRVFGLDVILLLNFKIKYDKIKAPVLHFIRNNFFRYKPWMPENPFYKEWIDNFIKAGLIDLNTIPKGDQWKSGKILHYSLLYDFYFHIFYFYYCNKTVRIIKNTFVSIMHLPERIIGMTGVLIKKLNPQIYFRIKKFFRMK